jgi:hypothetical protein
VRSVRARCGRSRKGFSRFRGGKREALLQLREAAQLTEAAKGKPSIPTLDEGAAALPEEVIGAPAEDAIDVIEAWREKLDDALSALAEARRPPSIPGPWLKQNWMAKAGGNTFEAYIGARREGD